MSDNTNLPLPTITQCWIDDYGWHGALTLLKCHLPANSQSLAQIDRAITLCSPEHPIEETIKNHKIEEIIKSLRINAADQVNPPPKGVLEIIK